MGDHVRTKKIPPWTNCPIRAMLARVIEPWAVKKFEHLWFFNTTFFPEQITENFGKWAFKADVFSNTVARHYSNTPLLGALDKGGLTPNVFANTAKILRRFQGTHVLEPIFQTWNHSPNAVGDRVRRINMDGISKLVKETEARVLICGDSSLNLGKSRSPDAVFKEVCRDRNLHMFDTRVCSGAKCDKIADALIEEICKAGGMTEQHRENALRNPESMPPLGGFVICFACSTTSTYRTRNRRQR